MESKFEDGKRLLPKPKLSVELLPFDVVISILIRLPARHLGRMRSVCRSWSLLISDSHFIGEYSKFRANVTKRPYIISLYSDSSYTMKFFSEGEDYHGEFDLFRDLVGRQFCTMSNSWDGLICVTGYNFTYLLNPSIQKVGALAKRSSHFKGRTIHSAGLGFNDSTGEYKVVRLYNPHQHGLPTVLCEICTVGNLHSPSCWKAIDGPPFEPIRHSSPVFVNGAIHWTIGNGLKEVTPEIVLLFDVKSEKFDVILHPQGSSRPPCSIVVELGGLVCLACTHRDWVQMDIWALKDYNNREWIKQYTIDLSAIYHLRTMLDYNWSRLFFMNIIMHDGKMVFCDGGKRDYYDPQRKCFVKHVHGSTVGQWYNTAYTESIVWPICQGVVIQEVQDTA